MNQRLYEGRFLVSVVGAVVRQEDLAVRHSRMDWERVYRLADSHHVAPILYLGTLGSWEPLPPRWKESMFERYVEALQCNDIFEDAAREVLTVLDMNQIPAVVLTSGREKKLYPIPEMGGSCVLRLFVPKDEYVRVKGYLVDLGYETEQSFKNAGERMRRAYGLRLELFYEMPFRPAFYRHGAARLMEESRPAEGFKAVRELTEGSEFLFRMMGAAYRYVADELTLLEMLDLYFSYKGCRESLGWERAEEKLSEFHVEKLSRDLLSIANLWFGSGGEESYARVPEQPEIFDAMEDRILTRGLINQKDKEEPQAVALWEAAAREREAENREEQRRLRREKRKKRFREWKRHAVWVFPGVGYMKSIYPVVGRIPILLPFFWGLRGVRMLRAGRDRR